MEYVEEVLKRADFSAEAGMKERMWEKISARTAGAVRDITFEELQEKSGVSPAPEKQSRKRAPGRNRDLGMGERTSVTEDREAPQAKRDDLVVKKPSVRGLGF